VGEIVTCTMTLLDTTTVVYEDDLTDTRTPGEVDPDRLRRDTREWFADWVARKEQVCERHEVELLGRHLYETLFRGKVRQEFEKRIDFVRKRADSRLRLQLIFHEGAKELARLPWEFLYLDRGDGDERFLAGEAEQYVLTRFVPLPDSAKVPASLERPVKVLLAACTTEGLEAEEIKELIALLKTSASVAPEVDLHELSNPTYAALKEAVQGVAKNPDGTAESWKPDIVHVIGHGEPGAILLRRDDEAIADDQAVALDAKLRGEAAPPVATDEPVEAMTLRGLFDPHHPPFVFLQTCYSDAVDSVALYTTAQRIVQAGVPAVVAMQYDIERGPADKFACRVYEQLFDGKGIAAAVSAGRILLREGAGATSPYRAFGTPVVYLGHDGPLVKERPKPRNKPAKANPEPEQRDAETRECPRCGRICRYRACPQCALRFNCEQCKLPLEEPLGVICGACEKEIQQPPWPRPEAPAGNGAPHVETTRVISRPALDSPVSPADQPLDQQTEGTPL
jgi:CHAT domain